MHFIARSAKALRLSSDAGSTRARTMTPERLLLLALLLLLAIAQFGAASTAAGLRGEWEDSECGL